MHELDLSREKEAVLRRLKLSMVMVCFMRWLHLAPGYTKLQLP